MNLGPKVSMVLRYIRRSGILHTARKNIFWSQKSENEPSEPKNEIWGPKSIWMCDISDISIDREFYMQQEKIYFRGSKRRI
jgi:hypothetical protein